MAALSKDVNTFGALPKVKVLAILGVSLVFTRVIVENENHCDFKKLRSLLIRTHMLDLISTSEELHYENYRQQQMQTRKPGEPKAKKLENAKFKEEEEQLCRWRPRNQIQALGSISQFIAAVLSPDF